MEATNSLPPLRRFFRMLKADRQDIFSIYIYAIFNGIVALSLPLGIQAIINLISVGQVSTSWIILVAIVILGLAFTGVMQIMQLTVTENLQQKIFTRSAFEFAYRLPRMKLEALDKYYAPELMNRFFDTLSVQKGLSKILIDFSTASLQIIFGLILLSFYHPFFVIFGILLVIVVILIFWLVGPAGLRTSLKESHYKYEVAHWLEELARTMGTFKLAGETDLPLKRTDEVVGGYLKSRKSHFKILVLQYIQMTGFKVLIAAGLLVIGGLLVINQQMNIGQFVASEIIIIQVIASVEKLITSLDSVYDVLTALEKLGNVTDLPLERNEGEEIEGEKGLEVSLKKLKYRFSKDSDYILKGIDLDIKPGENICISGSNGSGKSLLIQLIAGLYEDYEGSLTYNHIPLSNLNVRNLRSYIGDSLAKEDIFKGSIVENISLGRPDIGFEQVRKAAESIGIHEYIEQLPNGYYTMLKPEGKHLPHSFGLKIKLARSIVNRPKLLLLEDSFHLLRGHEAKKILEYLLDKKHPWTILAISNDPEKMKLFDRAIVLDGGEISTDCHPQEAIDRNLHVEPDKRA